MPHERLGNGKPTPSLRPTRTSGRTRSEATPASRTQPPATRASFDTTSSSRRTNTRAPAHKDSTKAAFDIEIVSSERVTTAGLADWLRTIAPARARGAVTIALVADRRVRALNRRYRHIDAATDVLSFPADAPGLLGDVVIGLGVARRQAREARHTLATELRVLALHGLLHLLGYDHEKDDGRMARVERRLRTRGGLHEGLLERA